ncbi:MAG TPA: glutamate formimidoyltransferase [Armatimonadota bacterium]|nr:glutamate formimidoyltransferase [Armatimonadota bacterium]
MIQCVPNFSEGRNEAVVEAIVSAARGASEVTIADYSFDPDHNRMVLSLLGTPEEIRAAVHAAAEQATKLIDLRSHIGAHPRVGAVDVVPLVPIRGVTMEDCVVLSYEIGHDLADLGIPVYFYEESATAAHRTNLSHIRRGGFEGLSQHHLDHDWAPDIGPHEAHATAGASVVGARGPLVAYNVNLNTKDMEIAQAIVRKIRSGEAGLEGVKSMSVWLATQGKAQVSMNITKPHLTSLKQVFDFVESQAAVIDAESEIIGLASERYLGCTPQELKATGFKETQILEHWL